MQLTRQQESLISRYLRDLGTQLDSAMPARDRDQRLRQIQSRIYQELESVPNKSVVTDEELRAILRRMTPARKPGNTASPQPAPAAPKEQPARPAPPEDDMPAPIWLGVCAFNADRFGLQPSIVRLAVVLFGLVTGPVAIVCYIAGFVEYYLALDPKERPAIAYGTLALRGIGPFAAVLAMRWGAYTLLDLLAYGYEKIFSEPMPLPGEWNWLIRYDGTIFFLICVCIVPISVLSGLPLANAWGHSLKRLAQALAALYFVALCFGIASILVGLILDRVQPYMQ